MNVTVILKSGRTYEAPETAVDNIYRMLDGQIRKIVYQDTHSNPFQLVEKVEKKEVEKAPISKTITSRKRTRKK